MIELIGFDGVSRAESSRVLVETAIIDRCLQLVYRWQGWTVAPIALARAVDPQRRDELWRTTCAEIFVALDDASDGKPHTGGPYLEFNFSPTGDWAAYRFDSTRTGMHRHVWRGNEAPRVSLAASSEDLTLESVDGNRFAAFAALRDEPVSHRTEIFLKQVRECRAALCALTGAPHAALLPGSGTMANEVVCAQIGLLDASKVPGADRKTKSISPLKAVFAFFRIENSKLSTVN